MKKPILGQLFSPDTSDDESLHERQRQNRYAKTSASDSEKRKPVRLKVQSCDEQSARSQARPLIPEPETTDDGYVAIDTSRLRTLKFNTLIQYEKNNGKRVKTKYFKRCDPITDSILVGFYTHGKRNYSEKLSNIKQVYILNSKEGGANMLKDTIELPQDEWKSLRRDMVISYEKDNNEFIYNAKFNSYVKASDGSSRMSLTSSRGFSFTMNPIKIVKIYRHITGNDKTLSFILEAFQKLEARVKALESKLRK